MAIPSAFTRAEIALRDYALAFPETREEFPWDHRAIKVKGKGFLFMGGDDQTFSFSLKLPTSGDAVLLLPFASPTGYGLGQSGWVTARFKKGDKIPLDWIKSWIEESYRAVAPKKLIARLAETDQPQPRTRPRARPSRSTSRRK